MTSSFLNYSFLKSKDQSSYQSNCLRRAVEGSKKCILNGEKYIEIEFPPNRKSDLSVTETLDTNSIIVREFVKAWTDYNKDLWVVFPDAAETSLAKKSKEWGDDVSFVITSIREAINAPKDVSPRLVVVVNPGFNVDEWIDIPKLERDCPIIVINGNLDRLRNGYYPKIFYPGLHKVSKDFYSKFVQAFYLSPIAVSGDRLGAWLARIYPDDWDVLVKDREGGFDVMSSSPQQPVATDVWRAASKESNLRSGRSDSWF